MNAPGARARALGAWLAAPPRARLMGILNVTPDSFSDGGASATLDAALRRAERLIAEGADLIDIGGESSRPGAAPVSEAEERRRVVPVVRAVRARFDVPLSVDTVKAAVAAEALTAGADWVNDVSALRDDPDMAAVAAQAGCPVVLMHRAGTARRNYQDFAYDDVVEDVARFFAERIAFATHAGIDAAQLLLDPGIGFGKRAVHNCALLNRLDAFARFGRPLLVGTSRKSFIGKLLGVPLEARLPSTIASALIAVQRGTAVVRVHDVAEVRQALMMAHAIERGPWPD